MPKDDPRIRPLLDPLDLPAAHHPVVVIPGKPALRLRLDVILLEMELVRRQKPGAAVGQVELHGAEAGGVAGGVQDVDALRELDVRAVQRLPVYV